VILRTSYLKLTEDHQGERARQRLAKALREGYAELPRVRGTEVALAADPAAKKGWDVAVHLRFDSEDAVAAWEQDPATRALEEAVLEPAVAFSKVWSWELV
tara:strand:- start:63 stop:365 length:303 start_codon:yes stop_codon:yes gene_type:complete